MDDKQTESGSVSTTSEANNLNDAPADWVDSTSDAPLSSQPQPEPGSSQDDTKIIWTASEFMDHDKSAGWYIRLAAVAVVVAGISFVVFDVITSVMILFVATVFGIYARRKPRQLEYQLDASGLSIASKHFQYGSFRAFSLVDEGSFTSITFLPMKRFGLLITAYFDPQDEDRIVDLIGQHLPLEPRDPDAIDRLMSRIRF